MAIDGIDTNFNYYIAKFKFYSLSGFLRLLSPRLELIFCTYFVTWTKRRLWSWKIFQSVYWQHQTNSLNLQLNQGKFCSFPYSHSKVIASWTSEMKTPRAPRQRFSARVVKTTFLLTSFAQKKCFNLADLINI